jgi:peptide/nickel transport system substrate-binding protein
MKLSKPTSGLLIAICVLATACAQPSTPSTPRPAGEPAVQSGGTRQPKSITVGITSTVQAFGLAGTTTTAGGWLSATELHTQGLVTSDVNSRAPVGRLAEKAPTFDDGSMSLLTDGRLKVVYRLRSGLTWQDRAPITSRDMAFSYLLNNDPGLPFVNRDATKLVESVETPDDLTFVINFTGPYYLADSLGPRLFWPYPQHLLGESYDRFLASKNAEEFLSQPFWSTAYISSGPFRLTSFDPGEGLVFEAYDGYFLGRPKVDTIRLRTFGNDNALLASLLAGAVDVYMDLALKPEMGFQLKERWEGGGEGTVHLTAGYIRILVPQYRASLQKEAGNFDVRVRRAMLQALDRPALAGALQGGHTEFAAWSILPTEDRNYEATKDAFKPFAYDPERAKALLREAGWTPGADGVVRSATDNRRFQTQIWTTPGSEQEISAIADYWRRVGLDVEEGTVPPAFTRDNQYRASYPGWETTANYADSVLGRLKDPAGPETRWAGANRAGYDDPRAVSLVDAYYRAMAPQDQLRTTRAISDFVVNELPFLPFVFEANNIGVRKGVRALEDVNGGAGAGAAYGSYTRNAHLWDTGS